MNVNTLYNTVLYICRKTKQLGYLPSEEFELMFNTSQIEYLNYLLGNFQQYIPNHPQAKVEIGANEILRQRLMPLHTYTTLSLSSGAANYPEDFQQVDSMENPTNFKPIRYVQQQYLGQYFNSSIDPIATNPIYVITKTGFQFYPTTLTSARLAYFGTPPDIFWNFTLDDNDRRVYNPTGSIDPIWYDTDIMDIVARMLLKIGVSLQATDIQRYANEIKNQGQ